MRARLVLRLRRLGLSAQRVAAALSNIDARDLSGAFGGGRRNVLVIEGWRARLTTSRGAAASEDDQQVRVQLADVAKGIEEVARRVTER